ncbi:hypothetical protein ACOQFL_14850 [Actinopolyspora sp. H202]|uniref:hypothetical protein n=1 Tax=Actinopolyspora TaxID=1849 RepID=UPI00115FAD46|nr:hypothetical protein [Actinopolyspora mzabensis]
MTIEFFGGTPEQVTEKVLKLMQSKAVVPAMDSDGDTYLVNFGLLQGVGVSKLAPHELETPDGKVLVSADLNDIPDL